jgi:hypothetical protein
VNAPQRDLHHRRDVAEPKPPRGAARGTRSIRRWLWERWLIVAIVLAAWVNAALLAWSLASTPAVRPRQQSHGLSKVSILTTRQRVAPLQQDGRRDSGSGA